MVRPIALFIIVSSRSINALIWALMLVTIIGPGVFAGIIAIALRSIGFCAKLLYEAIEEIDEGQVDAVRATGASGAQVTAYGIVPQVLPAFAGISVFRWDINIRESTVLGLVGAGGIGLELNAAITQLYWTQVSLILLDHHRHRDRQRMGFGQDPPRDHLIAWFARVPPPPCPPIGREPSRSTARCPTDNPRQSSPTRRQQRHRPRTNSEMSFRPRA